MNFQKRNALRKARHEQKRKTERALMRKIGTTRGAMRKAVIETKVHNKEAKAQWKATERKQRKEQKTS